MSAAFLTQHQPQVTYLKSPPRPDKLLAPTISKRGIKPSGGLWTSSLLDNESSAWVSWSKAELSKEWIKERQPYQLQPKMARIYKVIDASSHNYLIDNYKLSVPAVTNKALSHLFDSDLNWLAIAKDYDAIHYNGQDLSWLEENAEAELSLDVWATSPFRGWDVESTWWARWCFK